MVFPGGVKRLKDVLDTLGRQLPQIRRDEESAASIYGASPTLEIRQQTRRLGSTFHCPICGGAYQNFLPFGVGVRRNARCPGCGSLERHRFLYLYLQDTLRWPRRRLRVLHIAPEPCIRAELEPLPNIDYVCIDLFDRRAQMHMDITRLRLRDASVDGIICSHVLEHVSDDRSAISELFRVLKPGGRALILVPIDMDLAVTDEDPEITLPSERLARFGHPYHVRTCGEDYHQRIHEAGFAVDSISAKNMTPFRRRRYRINKCIIYDCRK